MVELNSDHSSLNYLLFHISYDGSFFYGSAYQPDVRTVHGLLFDVLRKLNVIKDVYSINIVSRTDRGVHALHNIALVKGLRIPSLSSVNMNLSRFSDCFVWGLTVLDDANDFRVIKKEYLYYLPLFLVSPELREDVFDNVSSRIKGFVGEHDFSAFIKKDKYERKSVHVIYSADVEPVFGGDALLFRFVGGGFGWEQIRRMIGFLIDKRWFSVSPKDYLDNGNGVGSLPIKPVPPEFLVLRKIWFLPEKEIVFSPFDFKGSDRYRKVLFSYHLKWSLMQKWGF